MRVIARETAQKHAQFVGARVNVQEITRVLCAQERARNGARIGVWKSADENVWFGVRVINVRENAEEGRRERSGRQQRDDRG